MTDRLDELFEKNKAWAAATEARRPGFFKSLLTQQAPHYLWIGCSDSRVPANEIVGLLPGEMFVHRNVGNVVVHSDLNCLSVIEFAIAQLQVKHIILVGHYGCSGVNAAMTNRRVGLADNWLRHIQDARNKHREWFETLPQDNTLRHSALCEINVLEQALNVCETTVVQDAWERGQSVAVHGWVYGLHNGTIEDLNMTVGSAAEASGAYARAVGALRRRYEEQVKR
jgi:carbonic anhydrase